MVNYDELDGVLNKIEPMILRLAGAYELKQASTERWRWDEPVITLTWAASDDISRNIHALITDDDGLLVEVNAWRDEDGEEGRVRVRSWQHEEIGRIIAPWLPAQVQSTLESAYSKVSGWGTKNLTKRTLLSTAGR